MEQVFEKIKNGQPVDMTTSEYYPAIEELHRTEKVLFQLNHTMPHSQAWKNLLQELFQGTLPDSVNFMGPLQIDFPRQVTFAGNSFINHHFTAMAIGGITIGEGVQIGPNVTIATDNHDLKNHLILRCKPVQIKNNVWIGACVTILPGVTIGENTIIGAGAVVTKDIPANCIAAGVPARVIRTVSP